MKKLLLTLVGIVCSLGMWAAEIKDLVAIKSNYTYTATEALTDKTLYDNDRILSLGGSGYSAKSKVTFNDKEYTPCVQIKNNRQIAMKIACNATITVVGNSNSSRAWQIGTTSTGKEIADGGNSSISASGNVEATEDEPVIIYINATSDLYLAAIFVTEQVDESTVATPSITSTKGASYGDPTTVSISCSTTDASIYYTTDGSTPTSSSNVYTGSFQVTQDCTVKAIAMKSGLTNSSVASENVTINNLRKINFDFSGVTLTQGSAIANLTSANNASYKLPSGRLYYVEGKTQTGWSDGTQEYDLGATVTVDKDYTFIPVFVDNDVELGAAEATVNWTFATSQGAPSAGIEGNVGYYAVQTTINGKKLDVVMTIDARQDVGISGSKGKWNTTAADNRAQVNKGTVFTIPAIKGMVVTMTITNGTAAADMFTFNGEQGVADTDAKTVSYTYNGDATFINVIDQGKNAYPAGLSVAYPAAEELDESDLAVENTTVGVAKGKTVAVVYTTSSTGNVTATSDKEDVATVEVTDNDIVITGVAAGTATITVSQASDETYAAGEKTIAVTVTDPTADVVVYNWNTVGTTTLAGSAATGTVNIKNVSTNGIKFGNGLSTTNYLKIESKDGGFKAGDVVTWTGCINNSSADKQGAIMIVSDAADGNAQLACSELFNNTYTTTVEATIGSFTLTEDAECLYIGRATSGISGATATWLTQLTITRAAVMAEATLNGEGYGTFSCAYPVKVDGAKVYTLKLSEDKSTLTATQVETGLVPAGEGVLLYGEAGATVTASYNASATALADNDLKATTLADGALAEKVDCLVLNGNTFGTYTGTAFAPNKAYLPWTVSAAKTLTIDFGGVTSINNVKVAQSNVLFNIAGQRVMNANGLVIKNGKKYVK